jgi:hypothetical protein
MLLRTLPARVLIVGALALPISFGTVAMTAPAGAATPAVSIGLSAPVAISNSSALPNSNIKGKKPTFTFNPGKLSVVWSAPPPETTCTAALEEATVTNDTSKGQKLVSGKTVLGTLPAHEATGFCFWGTGTHTFTLGIKGQKSKLKFNVS